MHTVTIITHDHTAQAQQHNIRATIDVPIYSGSFIYLIMFACSCETPSNNSKQKWGRGGLLIVTTIHTIMIVTCRLPPLSQKEETQMHVAGMHTKVI